ncbi:hypothetical protein [Thiolinea disciformis]|uniref:hypothetical protein n=1 Tax=Thiolinea disciformis TaxID=125614 RepID=UPI00035C44BC|nr:hypothetical protein [Thiolinea disciformis]
MTTATALRITAAISSITSAAAAYPVAASMFGTLAGGVIVTSSAAVIYAGWHYVGTETATDQLSIIKRVGAGLAASIFAVGMVAGIYTSASQSVALTTQTNAKAADALYEQQEASRIKTLETLTQELSLTSKKNNPAEYTRLQDQISKLSTPTERTFTATEKASSQIPAAYKWGIAATFEVVTPALLLLAGLFARRRSVDKQLTAVDRVDAASTTPSTLRQPQQEATLSQDAEQLEQANCLLDALADQKIRVNKEGCITAAALEESQHCTNRQARAAISAAVEHGYLIKEGEGGATRYRYPNRQQTTLWRVK